MVTRKLALPPKATHLAASMRVVASHWHMRRATVAAAKSEVLGAAAAAAGHVSEDMQRLIDKLERVTGVPIAELGAAAATWPDSA